MSFSERALQLIFEFEGLNQPGTWPGGFSGVTIGIGYDLGYVTVDQFDSDWGDVLTRPTLVRLREGVGLRGPKARNRTPVFADIRIARPPSERVFVERTLPMTVFRTAQAFPGFERLPLDAQGALVSLVYNRGTSTVDAPGEDRRREMRAIKRVVPTGDLREIARQIRAMKRLWQGKNLDGLLLRREAEAALVESCYGATVGEYAGAGGLRAGLRKAGRLLSRT
jgi:GH24 family phage-related lysozyme (muramidase)